MRKIGCAVAMLCGLGMACGRVAAEDNSNPLVATLTELVMPSFKGDNTFSFTLDVGSKSKAIIEKCAKGGHIFVGELNNREFICTLKETNEEHYIVEAGGLSNIPVGSENKTNCYRDEIFTISFAPLVNSSIQPMSLSENENKDVGVFVKKHVKQPSNDGSTTYSAIIGLEKNLTEYECIHAEKPVKINVSGQIIYFMPSFLIGTPLDESILTSVVLKDNGQYKLLGTIKGCITRFGSDLDKDGFPEVITKVCAPSEYQMYSYYKYMPSVKLLSALYQ